jgi:ATP-dependent protease HslVU (ClpYQ) peptidase subunit
MACDRQFTEGLRKWRGNTKIYRFAAHPQICNYDFLAGFAGITNDIMAVVDYFSLPDVVRPPKIRDMTGLVLTEKGKIYTFNHYSNWIPMEEPYAATGSGAAIALGAMSAGYSPKEAVKVASRYDIYSGMGTRVLTFERKE